MRYLLDVNALVAFGIFHHEFHHRASVWVKNQPASTVLVTCSIVELGFVRTLSRVPSFGFTVREANALLADVKKATLASLLPDTRDLSHLPKWAKSHHQLTDGHLVDLAHAHGALLATFDRAIPGAFLIP